MENAENDLIDDNYCRAASDAYWAEEIEYRLGTHPEQIKEKIEKELVQTIGDNFGIVTALVWQYGGMRVGVLVNGEFYGIFNYEENKFESCD